AVTSTARLQALPEIPTIGDFVPGFETSAWAGIGAPKKTPAEIIDALNREINGILAEPAVQARFTDLGGQALALTPDAYASLIAQETDKWAKVIKFSGARADLSLLYSSAYPLGVLLMDSEVALRFLDLVKFGRRV